MRDWELGGGEDGGDKGGREWRGGVWGDMEKLGEEIFSLTEFAAFR